MKNILLILLSLITFGAFGQGTSGTKLTAGNIGNYAWETTGNAGTSSATNFIGTTDNVGLSFKVNGVYAGKIDSATAYWGIGTTAPTSKLHVVDDVVTTGVGADFTSSSLTTGNVVRVSCNATNTTHTQGGIFQVARTGTLSGGTANNIAAVVYNNCVQASTMNIGLYAAASGGAYNHALYVPTGTAFIGYASGGTDQTTNLLTLCNANNSGANGLWVKTGTGGAKLYSSVSGSLGAVTLHNIYNGGANSTLGIGCNSTSTILLNGNDYCGIGQTTPTSKLHVTDNSATTTPTALFSSSSQTTGFVGQITSTSTALNAGGGLNIAVSGANANATRTAYGGVIAVTNTGTASTNVALSLSASGATTNTALLFPTNASYIEATGTGANGLVIKNLKNSTNTAVSGTAITIEIDIAGTPYYFLAYPTTTP